MSVKGCNQVLPPSAFGIVAAETGTPRAWPTQQQRLRPSHLPHRGVGGSGSNGCVADAGRATPEGCQESCLPQPPRLSGRLGALRQPEPRPVLLSQGYKNRRFCDRPGQLHIKNTGGGGRNKSHQQFLLKSCQEVSELSI